VRARRRVEIEAVRLLPRRGVDGVEANPPMAVVAGFEKPAMGRTEARARAEGALPKATRAASTQANGRRPARRRAGVLLAVMPPSVWGRAARLVLARLCSSGTITSSAERRAFPSAMARASPSMCRWQWTPQPTCRVRDFFVSVPLPVFGFCRARFRETGSPRRRRLFVGRYNQGSSVKMKGAQ
jgi:hypothetical protein